MSTLSQRVWGDLSEAIVGGGNLKPGLRAEERGVCTCTWSFPRGHPAPLTLVTDPRESTIRARAKVTSPSVADVNHLYPKSLYVPSSCWRATVSVPWAEETHRLRLAPAAPPELLRSPTSEPTHLRLSPPCVRSSIGRRSRRALGLGKSDGLRPPPVSPGV